VTATGPSAWAEDVGRYYDSNTRRFLLLGTGRGVHSMHRELWAPGIESAREAADHIHRLVGEELADLAAATAAAPATATGCVIVDFGCGVGGMLFRLAERFPGARLRGVTVSRRQVEIAERLARELGYADRCSFAHGDFQSTDLGLRADVVVAVESFAHSESADAFLANAARHLRPGGRLVIADDFLARDQAALDERQRRRVEELRAGWRVQSVCTVAELERSAARRGLHLEKAVDLTPLTRPGRRVRDRVVAAVAPLLVRLDLARIPFYGNMIGGNALQVGLRESFLLYHLLVLRKGDRVVAARSR
jgi:tocopherol O-methyltransferase